MSKKVCEPIKLTVDSLTQLYHLIDASINNYDIYVKQIKVRKNYSCIDTTRYEVKLYERKDDEQSNINN